MLGVLRLLGHQDWIRYGIRNRIISHFCSPDTTSPHSFEIDFFGSKYRGNLNCYIDWVVYFFGAYERQELFLLRDLIRHKDNPIFIDIGANIGQHSLFMSKYCKEVHAFEPYNAVMAGLEEKIKLNNIKNIITHSVGIGETNKELDFFAPKGSNTGSGSFVATHEADNNEYLGKLRVVNGDDYLNDLGLKRIDLIKIDVEDFEKSVIMGIRETLKKFRPIVFMEYSEETKLSFSGEDEFRSILPEGYRISTVIPGKPFALFFYSSGYEYLDFNFETSDANIVLTPF
jgi:FkbM family methyltransferase